MRSETCEFQQIFKYRNTDLLLLFSIITPCFNGHSHLWDHVQAPDALGDKITDWIISKDLHVLNDGSTTRTCQITVNYSTPDLSLCGCNWSTKTSWTLAEPIGNLDYLPITIVINHIIRYQPVTPRKARWLHNDIDWSSFTNEVELQIQQLLKEPNILIRVS